MPESVLELVLGAIARLVDVLEALLVFEPPFEGEFTFGPHVDTRRGEAPVRSPARLLVAADALVLAQCAGRGRDDRARRVRPLDLGGLGDGLRRRWHRGCRGCGRRR